jgi:hypothetical protein
MTHENHHRPADRLNRRLLVTMLVSVLAMVGFSSPAWAGGWAVTTLDEVPTPVAGTPVNVGFTIRQHGVTPVDLKDGVAIEITAADGTVSRFPATGDGVVGHYVASVTFPASGEYTWTARQGPFADHELGTIVVGSAASGASAGGGSSTPWLGYSLLVATLGLALVALVDVVVSRRRRVTPA